MVLIVVVEAVPGFEDLALGAVFPELAGFVVLEDTEGLVDAAGDRTRPQDRGCSSDPQW